MLYFRSMNDLNSGSFCQLIFRRSKCCFIIKNRSFSARKSWATSNYCDKQIGNGSLMPEPVLGLRKRHLMPLCSFEIWSIHHWLRLRQPFETLPLDARIGNRQFRCVPIRNITIVQQAFFTGGLHHPIHGM